MAAGNKVWVTQKGFATQCSTTCDWTAVHDFGTDAAGWYNVGTALAVSGVTIYAAWVDSNGNPSPSFQSGIDTNYGGTWHRIASPVLPNSVVDDVRPIPGADAVVVAMYGARHLAGGPAPVTSGACWTDARSSTYTCTPRGCRR